MRKIREALRLRHEMGLSKRAIAQSLSVSHSTIIELLGRAEAAGVSWPLPTELDDAALETKLYPGNPEPNIKRPMPDWSQVHQELRRKGVTLQLLWLEYRERHPDGYQYSHYCELYGAWCGKLEVVMRGRHLAGEEMLVDYVGLTMSITEPITGKQHEAPIFVAVLPASNYTYAEAHLAQDLTWWIGGHCRAYEFFDGVAAITVPDNTKTAVRAPNWYEPDINPTYLDMAAHYGTVVIPARPRRPRDKAKVETAVQVVERWIIAKLRHRTFFSLEDLNQPSGDSSTSSTTDHFRSWKDRAGPCMRP